MTVKTIPVGTLGTNCYILSSAEKNCAVIDPGAQPEKIMSRIKEDGLNVLYILLTHGHHDHIGGVNALAREYPEARILIGKNDLEMLTDNKKSLALIRYSKPDDFIVDRAETLADGQELVIDDLTIRVIDTPGHTKGGVCYICGDVMFSGDTLFHGDVGRCDLYGGDYGVMKATLRKLVELEGDYRVCPGHGSSSSLGSERKNNPYIAEAVAEAGL